jgi:uncharacterized protein YndB with AHSA1/START domain
MTDFNHYRFVSTWELDAPPDVVYSVLQNTEDYPKWWPEVRRVRRIDDRRAEMAVRSLLPYDLVFVTEESRQDPEARVLEAAMAGDLGGFSRWTLAPAGLGTRAVFEEDVIAHKALLRRLALVARPAFRANHTLMMRHGREGLRTYLAGYRAATRPE